jgi:pyrroline-5-carboxylate reductase
MAKMKEHIAFLGGGNMAEALISGLLRQDVVAPEQIRVTDIQAERCQHFTHTHRIHADADNGAAVAAADVIVLAVKPQIMHALLAEIAPALTARHLVISIAAGIPLAALEPHISGRVIRAMPNTPALVGQGVTAICGGTHATEADYATAETLLAGAGMVVRVQEADMDAVTAVSGSGPAYVFYLMEAMTEAADRLGLAPAVARDLIVQTVAGAAALVRQTGTDPATLRARVTSKGGTTAAAIAVMDEEDVHDHLVTAILSADQRARELSAISNN